MTQTAADAGAWTQQLDAYVAEAKEKAGLSGAAPLFTEGPYSFPLMCEHITPDLLRRHARAIGDSNPLWADTEYGDASPWGSTIGPPMLEALLSESASMPNPPQLQGCNFMQGGARREFHRPFRPGDVIRAEDTWHGIEEKTRPDRPYRLFMQNAERRYINQRDEVVVSLFARIAVTATPPDAGSDAPGPDFTGRTRRRYTEEELATVVADYESELSGKARRGAEPRLWEDVEIGDTVPAILKGPYDISDAVAFAGAMGLCSAFALKWREVAPDVGRLPADPETGAPHHAIDWHLDDRVAQGRGVAYAIAFGTQSEMVMMHPVTNWMSDAGFVISSDIQIRSPQLMGEISRTGGEVVGKSRDGERHLVELAVSSQSLDGPLFAKGTIVVDLPSRDGYSPAQRIAR